MQCIQLIQFDFPQDFRLKLVTSCQLPKTPSSDRITEAISSRYLRMWQIHYRLPSTTFLPNRIVPKRHWMRFTNSSTRHLMKWNLIPIACSQCFRTFLPVTFAAIHRWSQWRFQSVFGRESATNIICLDVVHSSNWTIPFPPTNPWYTFPRNWQKSGWKMDWLWNDFRWNSNYINIWIGRWEWTKWLRP